MNRKRVLAVALLSSFLGLGAVSGQTRMALWPEGQVPNYQPSTEKEYRDTGDVIAVKKVQVPEMTAYFPTKLIATGQAVVICPGGGYGQLSWDLEGTDIASWLVSHGVAAFVLKYRLPGAKSNVVRYKSPLLDAARAVRIVRANASKWHIDTKGIGIMGFSAGGHLASSLETHFDGGDAQAKDSIDRFSSRPDFGILAYPVISMYNPELVTGTASSLLGSHPSDSLRKYFSSELQVTAATPPTFLVHAMDDKSVNIKHSILFYEALKEHNVAGDLHIFSSGGHGFGLGLHKGEVASWTDLCINWMKSLQKRK